MTTLTVNIKDISQIAIIKKILKAFDVEVIEQNNEITNPEIIQRLEKHHKNFRKPAYREENYTKVDAKNIWQNNSPSKTSQNIKTPSLSKD